MFRLSDWITEGIDDECRVAYRTYHGEMRHRHVAYFEKYPKRRDTNRPFVAKSFGDGLPLGWEQRLSALIPEERRHRHHLSGGSSQTLALALLGPAALGRPHLDWLFEPNRLFVSWDSL